MTLTRRRTREEVGDADVFVKIRPVNTDASSDESPVASFRDSSVLQARKPCERRCDGAAVGKIDRNCIIGDRDTLRRRLILNR